MSNFKLNPIYLRPEVLPGYEKAAWRPEWKCFCCQDSGLVKDHLVKKVIEGYDPKTQKLVRCNATDCKSRDKYSGDDIVLTGTLDCRFPTVLCDEFDRTEREEWRKWCKDKHERRKLKRAYEKELGKIDNNLRTRPRTSAEQLEAERKHDDTTDFFNRDIDSN